MGEGKGLEAAFQRVSWYTSCCNTCPPPPPKKGNAMHFKTKQRHQSGINKTNDHYFLIHDGPPGTVGLHSMSTLPLDVEVLRHVQQLQDQHLLRKLSTVDIVTSKAKYTKSVFLHSSGANLNLRLTNARVKTRHICAELVAYILKTSEVTQTFVSSILTGLLHLVWPNYSSHCCRQQKEVSRY